MLATTVNQGSSIRCRVGVCLAAYLASIFAILAWAAYRADLSGPNPTTDRVFGLWKVFGSPWTSLVEPSRSVVWDTAFYLSPAVNAAILALVLGGLWHWSTEPQTRASKARSFSLRRCRVLGGYVAYLACMYAVLAWWACEATLREPRPLIHTVAMFWEAMGIPWTRSSQVVAGSFATLLFFASPILNGALILGAIVGLSRLQHRRIEP
jgi:hypothetical protein